MIIDDSSLAEYNNFRKEHPKLFVNLSNPAFEIVLDPQMQRDAGAGVIYRDKYFVLLRDAVRFRDGYIGPYIRMISTAGQGGAAVLPLIGGNIVLIQHERHATRAKHWEIPRGFAIRGETAQQTARRELIEELGVPEAEIFDLGSVHPDTGISNVHTRLYAARLTGVGHLEENEGIDESIIVTFDEFEKMLVAEQITDSFTLAAVLQARVRGLIG